MIWSDLLRNKKLLLFQIKQTLAKEKVAPFFELHVNPVTGGLWLSDTAHHHVAIAVLFLVAGHMYRTNWGIGHSMKQILEAHAGKVKLPSFRLQECCISLKREGYKIYITKKEKSVTQLSIIYNDSNTMVAFFSR